MIHPKRHIAKAISWRIVGSIDTMVVAGLITGDWKLGLSIGGIEVMTKMVLYYFHERFWYKYVKFGVDNDED